jgi:glycosyltransferase involved in cell wall biosynthesis
MRIVRVHNRYQLPGGEDAVIAAETRLLEERGHSILNLTLTNEVLDQLSVAAKVRLPFTTVWSRRGRQLVTRACKQHLADLVHFDNTVPLVSPAAYYLASDPNVAVVQTLHNYRLNCPAATFFRDGHVCEDCVGKTPPYPSVVHGCYRDSHVQTGVIAAMLTTHRVLRTYERRVDRYIAPAEKILVKPNFVEAPRPARTANGPHMLFVGRLAPEKGIRTMLTAQRKHGRRLRIVGNGPLASEVAAAALADDSLEGLGQLDSGSVRAEMLAARALIFPSEWYEGFPVTLVEAFASSLPVIVARLGSMAEIVEDGVTGLHFEPGNPNDLAAKIRWASEHSEEMRRMGENARREFEIKYTPERNYDMLIEIYREALDHARRCR